MKVKEKKTVRFDALVKQAGQPEQATLWSKPEHDREFMAAVKAHRIVTVVQHNVGTKKDFGLVGFFPKEKATFFVFPKAIDEETKTKVVSIKYDQIAGSKPRGAVQKPRRGTPLAKKAQPRKPNIASQPIHFTFRAVVELTARQIESIDVQARSSSEAAALIQARAPEIVLDPEKAKVTRAVRKPRKLK